MGAGRATIGVGPSAVSGANAGDIAVGGTVVSRSANRQRPQLAASSCWIEWSCEASSKLDTSKAAASIQTTGARRREGALAN